MHTKPLLKQPKVALSIVIPVYNGSATIAALVQRIHRVFAGVSLEVILVNDGSADNSERVCAELVDAYPATVVFIQLARNFGEHNAVLAGMNHARGAYVGVLDDDGQNPPEELLRMLQEIQAKHFDVVYGRYRIKRHGWFRNLGSWFADRIANIMLKKPRELYLSSFKVMNRFAVNEVIKYRGPFPYIDGLLYRTTTNIGQIDVEHRERQHGRSSYTLGKLVRVWMNMFLNFSILPLRFAAWTGLAFALGSMITLGTIWIQKVQLEANPRPGFPTLLCCVVFFGGLNLLVVGMLGEYLGRLFLDHNGTPQYVLRRIKRSRRVAKRRIQRSARRSSETDPLNPASTPPFGIASETIVEASAGDEATVPSSAAAHGHWNGSVNSMHASG